MSELPDTVKRLLLQQDGVVTRAQLLAEGVTAATVDWHAGRSWRVVLPHTYLIGRGDPTERQRHIAALCWAGPSSVLAGATAARAHGVRGAEPGGRVQVLVPAPKRSRNNTFVQVRRTLLADPFTVTRGAIRLSSPARSCVDAALATASASARSALLIEAVQRGVTSLVDLAEWVHRLRTRDAARIRAALDDAATGAWSLPEAELLSLLAATPALAHGWPNPLLTDAHGLPLLTPDLWFDDVAMAVMVHSRTHHSHGDDWDATVERDGGLVAAGVVVAGVTPHRIRTGPAAVVRRLEQTYETASRRSRPPVTATPRHVVRSRLAG